MARFFFVLRVGGRERLGKKKEKQEKMRVRERERFKIHSNGLLILKAKKKRKTADGAGELGALVGVTELWDGG